MFVWGYIAVTSFISWRWRSKAAYVALPALVVTMAMFWFNLEHAGAYSSSIWALAGLYLLINKDYISGVLYGVSGFIYIGLYLGALDDTLSTVHIVSDLAFILGLIAGTWSGIVADASGSYRRFIRRVHIQIATQDNQGIPLPDRG